MAMLLKNLSETFGVSGCEHKVRQLIIGEIKDKVNDITVDTMGNIIAFKKGKIAGKTIAVCVNMDEVGLIISEITDKGYIKFKPVGDISSAKLVSKRVITEGGVKGVLGMKAIHLQTRAERDEVKKTKDLYIDIGAKDKEDAEKYVHLGEYMTFDTAYGDLGDNIKGKAMERAGLCAALTDTLSDNYPYDFYAVFTAQHEVGARGAMIAAHRINADVILSLGGMDTNDTYMAEGGGAKLNGGAVISYHDRGTIGERHLTDRLIALAKEKGIKIQPSAGYEKRSDGYAMQIRDTKIISAHLPCRYTASPVEIVSKGDIKAVGDIIKLYLNKIGEIL